MSKSLYLKILKFGIFLSLISVFLVFKSLLFPYISSKQIYFNILIEILMVFWLAFIVKYPEYRPKKSYITYGLSAFFAVIFVSCFTGVDFNLSFWGDVERMLGFFHIFHFFLFYLILISIMREWQDWKVLFIISLVIANLESLHVLTVNTFGTIGNTAYVSGYLIFNIYFALLLFFREQNKILRYLYILAIPLLLLAFNRADTSGAQVGLGFSVLVFFFLYGILCKNKKLRRYTLSIGAIALILVVILFTNKNTNFVQSNSLLSKVNSISLQKNTFQTRLISWKAAAKDFKNHPFLGTGHGNYAIIFDKYFDSSFYSHTASETYFDRAHNNVIDIASTTGSLGFITYLSIFIAAVYYLFLAYFKKRMTLIEFSLVTCLLIAYFVQNLAVFDSLVTYIGIMMVLAYIYWLYSKDEETLVEKMGEKINKVKNKITNNHNAENTEVYVLIIASFISLLVIYHFNIKPVQMLIGTIDGHIAYQQGETEKAYDKFKTALALDTVLNRDANSIYIRLISGDVERLKSLNQAKVQEMLDFGIKLAEENVNYNPGDSMNQIIFSQILDATARYYVSNPEKFTFYSDRALEAVNKSIEASPGRATNYYFKAQLLSLRADREGAIETLRYAVDLNDKFANSHCYLAKFLVYYELNEEAYKSMDACIDLNGLNSLTPDVVRRVANHYIEAGDYERVEKIVISLTILEPKNIENWINLVKYYGQIGEKEKARAAADKAIELDYGVKQYADDYVNSIK